MHYLRWAVFAFILLVLLSVFAMWSYGHFAQRARGKPSKTIAVTSDQTALDRLVSPLLDTHPGQSGAVFVADAVDAFNARSHSAQAAERSLDVQYYIWRHDITGRLLQRELMQAAERGVRVRLLIDDVNVAGHDNELLSMDAHPNVEVRVFNPARNRSSRIRRTLEMILRFVGFNRRMHNKAWIVDNRVAIVGGRNVGDVYFGVEKSTDLRDTDMLLVGPAVDQSSVIFDRFWNSKEVIPLRALHKKGSQWSEATFDKQQHEWLADAQASELGRDLLAGGDFIDELDHGRLKLHWSNRIRVISDPPGKAAPLARRREASSWLQYDVMALLYSANKSSWLMSPYFVPGDAGNMLLLGQESRGIHVRALTNSLMANDVSMVHAAYTKYREALVKKGVEIYELRPLTSEQKHKLTGYEGASLHSKAIVVDNQRGFLGSFNFDPRSAQLNTEMGVFFNDKALAQELTDYFNASTAPDIAWRVGLNKDGQLRWFGEDGHEWEHEPKSGFWYRAWVHFLSYLPIESHL